MPIPNYGLRARERPGGLVEPSVDLTGITEIRVHGVGGTSPEHLLADQLPQQVSGDSIAGFYRGDDLGPVEASATSTEERRMSRHVEAYSWGGTTSKSSSRVLWLFLLPFMLVNIAGWACSNKIKASPKLFVWHQRVMRVVCLALTLNVVLVFSFISADLCAYQAPRAGALGNKWWLWPLRWGFVANHPGRSLVVGFAAPIVLILFLARIGQLSADRYERVRPPIEGDVERPASHGYASSVDLDDRDFFNCELSVRYAMWLHIAAATAFVAVLLDGTARATAPNPSHAIALWWIAIALGIVALVATVARLVFWEKVSDGSDRIARYLFASALVAVGLAAAYSASQKAYTAVQPRLPGFATAMLWSFVGFLAVVVILALLELPTAKRGAGGPVFRWAPPLITLVAFGLLNTVMFGMAFVVAHNLGSVVFATKDAGTGAFYLSPVVGRIAPELVLAIVVAAILFLSVEFVRMRHHRAGENLETVYADDTTAWQDQRDATPRKRRVWMENALEPPDKRLTKQDERWAKKVGFWRWFESFPLDTPLLIWLVLVLQACVVVIALADRSPLPSALYAPGTIWAKAAVAVATAAPVVLMARLRAGWKSPSQRKTIGIIWDVGTFWPRAYHPLAPPSYAERAVPDLQRRIWWLTDNGGKTVIAAHSQGTILAAAALLQMDCRSKDDTVALVTFGSPLCKLFHWAFPSYFSPEVLAPLAPCGEDRVHGWRNFHYPTDPIAGPIFPPDNPIDVPLLDPATGAHVFGQPAPPVGAHSGYWTDARVWSVVDQIADSL